MTIKLRLEKKVIREGEDFELPDYSFNHAYVPAGSDVILYYLVPTTEQDALRAQIAEIVAHLLKEYK